MNGRRGIADLLRLGADAAGYAAGRVKLAFRDRDRLSRSGGRAIFARMLNLVSILIGLVTLVLGLVAFVPLLGWMNWLVIPIGIVGAAVGALSASKTGRNLNLILIVIFAIRLSIGGGII